MTVGFVYAITTQSHVRVDIFHSAFSDAKKARIEIFGLGWFLLPFLVMMTDILVHYAWASILAGEGSDSANGLHRLFLLKASLPLIFSLAMLACISMLVRYLSQIGSVRLWSVLLAMFPAAWFISERVCHYFLWWFVRLIHPEIKSGRIAKEPLLEHTIWYGFALVIATVLISFLIDHRQARG